METGTRSRPTHVNKQQIQNKLKDPKLTTHERESLLQYLHYLTVEGIDKLPPKSKTRKPRR